MTIGAIRTVAIAPIATVSIRAIGAIAIDIDNPANLTPIDNIDGDRSLILDDDLPRVDVGSGQSCGPQRHLSGSLPFRFFLRPVPSAIIVIHDVKHRFERTNTGCLQQINGLWLRSAHRARDVVLRRASTGADKRVMRRKCKT